MLSLIYNLLAFATFIGAVFHYVVTRTLSLSADNVRIVKRPENTKGSLIKNV